MRTILRTILAFALLLGSGVSDWAPVSAQAVAPGHESCCCGSPADVPDPCPCPKPEGNRNPTPSGCAQNPVTVVALAARRTQAQRKIEPRPEPAAWAQTLDVRAISDFPASARGRAPDLGRHLAQLGTFRI